MFPFQKHENEEDGASGNKDGGGRENKEADVAISFVFGQNIKDRAKVGYFPLVLPYLTYSERANLRQECVTDKKQINTVKCDRQRRGVYTFEIIL